MISTSSFDLEPQKMQEIKFVNISLADVATHLVKVPNNRQLNITFFQKQSTLFYGLLVDGDDGSNC